MEAVMVYDNYTTNEKIIHGWGFSCLLDGHILFDAGEDGDKLLENLESLNIDLEDISRIVISHDHWDHQGGYGQYLQNDRESQFIPVLGLQRSLKIK